MAETVKKTTKKAAAKKTASKKKPETLLDELFVLVQKVREAGYEVHIRTSRVNSEGVSEERGR